MSLIARAVRGAAISAHAGPSPTFVAPTAITRKFSAPQPPHPRRPFHSTQSRNHAKPKNPKPTDHPATEIKPPRSTNFGSGRFSDFDLKGRTFIVTGGAQGLGLSLAEALVEAGGKVYCLDQQERPHEDYAEALKRVVPEWGGSLHYRQADVVDTEGLDKVITEIADKNQRLDGVIAAAGIMQIESAMDYTVPQIEKMLAVNYTGVFMTAQSAARNMFKYKNHGSICLIASMSGLVANIGMLSPAYNSSKAAVIQLARNLAMEWSPMRKDGSGGIRVNCISPGHILTPMVEQNFREVPGLKEEWEGHNMFGRLAETTEFKGAGLFLMSNASTFMTGSQLVIDGGHTAW
ncbi:L-xylulose reductase [Colletotrichum siamense]|uniref:L-xylulose reductase n=1 Tax=Colletotrichum siamense TaxID=690259 RepID=A0A9P5EX16_COLSI|nr:L-xylulose reductase [Colletotrichum siamense]KAF4860892.1 L-xylulose reductase [Colletotrichum siamense]KAF4869495.1 L-xylulose reductase [Colletotrichum siamense]